MGVILPILLLGLMASLSPSTIVVFILLLLGTTKARVNALAFLVGWGLSLTVVFTASYALGATQDSPRHSHTAVELAEVLLGIVELALGLAVRSEEAAVARIGREPTSLVLLSADTAGQPLLRVWRAIDLTNGHGCRAVGGHWPRPWSSQSRAIPPVLSRY